MSDTIMFIVKATSLAAFIFLVMCVFSETTPEIHVGDRVIVETKIIDFTVDDDYTEGLVKEISPGCVKIEYYDRLMLVQRSTWVTRSQITDVLPASKRPLSAESSP